jgi:hypothetical protein
MASLQVLSERVSNLIKTRLALSEMRFLLIFLLKTNTGLSDTLTAFARNTPEKLTNFDTL